MVSTRGLVAEVLSNNRSAILVGSAILAVGFGLSGYAIGDGLVRMKHADRQVTVRGVAQRDVTANRATWQARYSEHAHDLPSALSAADRDGAMIVAYLHSRGFAGTAEARTAGQQGQEGAIGFHRGDQRYDRGGAPRACLR